MNPVSDDAKKTGMRWRNLLAGFVLGVIVCTLVAVFLTSQWYFAPSGDRHPVQWTTLFGHYLIISYVWGLLTIGIWPTMDRIGFARNRLIWSITKYLLAGIAFSIAHFLLGHVFVRLFGLLSRGGIHGGTITGLQLIGIIQSNLILFTVISSVCLAVSYFRKYQDRELRTSKLENQLTLAQLGALKSQLQPHFLFNTMNAIAALIVENPSVAEEMVVKLSDLLRATLDNVNSQELSMRDELEFSRRYLEIEKMRFGDRLRVIEQIESDIENALVPALVLQPLIENAIRHGVASISSPCTVTISGYREGSVLYLAVTDTGAGVADGVAHRNGGVGLQNTRDRLMYLYGDRYRFQADNVSGGGFRAAVEIPFCERMSVSEAIN